MVLTKRDIQKLRVQSRLIISIEQEAVILEHFGTEPDDQHEWSEQDIYEQIRKMI
jgi:hypothetical protein